MSRLPCHKGVGARAGAPRAADQLMGIANHQKRRRGSGNPPANGRRTPGDIPYVSPDGGYTRYYADRCYLDAPTGLVEYQLEKQRRKAEQSNSTQWRREYCNRCGEIKDDTHQPRGAKAPPPERVLFDRAKFINSLDLSAAIVGTYNLADFAYMSDEFPRLFPRPGGKGGGGSHVPTLVLHGQKGFSVEKWAAGDTPGKDWTAETKAPTTYDDDDGVPVTIRGGGESSSPSQQLPETQCSGTVQFSEDVAIDVPKSPEGKKRPMLTYDNKTLKLPKTPKRLRMGKRPRSAEKDDGNSKGKNADREEKKEGGSDSDVIVIDSDTEEEPEPKEDVKRAATKVEKETPAEALELPPASSTADGQRSGPVQEMQQPQNDSSMTTAPLAPPELTDNVASKPPPIPEAAPTAPSGALAQTAASTLARVLGKPPRKKIMRPIFYNSGPDSSQDSGMSADLAAMAAKADGAQKDSNKANEKQPANQQKVGWGGVKPAQALGGEVFFTQVLPRWCPPIPKDKRPRSADSSEKKRASPRSSTSADCSDDDAAAAAHAAMLGEEGQKATKNDDGKKTVRGVHHPKFYLLFERSGSLVVIVTTSNLSPQTSVDGSWVQRFEPKESAPRPSYINRSGGSSNGSVDFGVSDFGAVLTDFLQKQSDAAEGGMLPDVFLRRYVAGLSSGLSSLADRYRFEDAQVHLVSTVPGDHQGGLRRRAIGMPHIDRGSPTDRNASPSSYREF